MKDRYYALEFYQDVNRGASRLQPAMRTNRIVKTRGIEMSRIDCVNHLHAPTHVYGNREDVPQNCKVARKQKDRRVTAYLAIETKITAGDNDSDTCSVLQRYTHLT